MKKIYLAIPLIALFSTALPAYALKTIDAQDKQTYYADGSAHDLNNISLENGRLRRILGNAADFIVEKDDKTGQFSVRFRDAKKTSSVTVIADDGRTYTLVLKPVDKPAENFVIRDPMLIHKKKVDSGKKDQLEQAVRDLTLTMAGAKVPNSHVFSDDNQRIEELMLWQGTKFFRVSTYESGNLRGDKYRLYNVSDKPIRLAEQEFFKDGVIAVSIQTHELDIGRDTYVYVVKQGGAE